MPDGGRTYEQTCSRCGGDGETVAYEVCPVCDGDGTVDRLPVLGRSYVVNVSDLRENRAGSLLATHMRVVPQIDAEDLLAEVERLRVFRDAFAKVPQEMQARIMRAVEAERNAS